MRRIALLTCLAVATGACAQEQGGGGGGELVAIVANLELAADGPSRFLLGLETPDRRLVTGGSVDLRFSFLGEERAEGQPQPGPEATATFLPLPGESAGPPSPQAVAASEARGVYSAEGVEFDRPGFWEVEATADLGGDVRRGTAAFQVLPEPLVPAPGDPAPRTRNHTLDSKGVPVEAIDSRAAGGAEVPDPELHQATIAGAIRAGRPALVVIATPVYCVSRFCGPVTDMVAELASEYGDRAEFIHIEVWRDFQEGVINEAAADWLLRDDDLTEPWVFLIGADGRIAARWDNVAARQEIEPLLQDLPSSG
ncbi:MAG: hypothetical protein ACRDH8_09955 [Actinomycetota bacterium]